MLLILAVALFLSLFILQEVHALGITPGRAVFDFLPGRKETVDFKVINNEHKDMGVVIYVEGELNQSVTLHQKMIKFKATDQEKDFKYSFKLPDSLDKPGVHVARIIAMEIPEDAESGTFVGATVAVATELYIQVPYPGKYIEARMDIQESDVNGTTKFIVVSSNLGEQKIARAYALIDVLSKTNEKLATIKTSTFEIASKRRVDLVGEWKANVEAGTYLARATIIYDEKTAEIEKSFNIGSLRIDLIDVVVEDFRLGGIAKFTLVAESKWNADIPGVYSNVIVYDAAGKTIADSKSASVDFPALSRQTMFAYWDTAGVDEGDYDGKIVLNYADKMTDRAIRVKVRESEMQVEIVGLTAKVVGAGSSNKSNFWLIALIVMLVLINVSWFVYFRNRMKRREKNK